MKYLKSFEQWCIEEKAFSILKYYKLGNNSIPADKVGRSANKNITFCCDVCNLTWTRNLNKIRSLKLADCPYCNHIKPSKFYNFQTEYPMLIQYWDTSKNIKMPYEYLPRSDMKVFWKCNICGNKWEDKICNMVDYVDRRKNPRNVYCPYCNHERVWSQYNLLTESPDTARQWNYEKNGNLKPTDMFPKSSKYVYWKCDFNPNHTWRDRISNRTVLHRTCPKCSKEFRMSYPEKVIYYYLQKFFPDCCCEVPINGFVVDIVIPSYNIAIEHDGYYIHKGNASINRDYRKDITLKNNNFFVIRIKESTSKKSIEIEDNIIYYPYSCTYEYLDDLVKILFSFLSKLTKEYCNLIPNHQKDNYNIEQLYFHEKKQRTLAVKRPDISQEWSPNNKDTPDTISFRNPKEVLWICKKCSTEFKASIINRTAHNSGCPYCINRKANSKNCLETLSPELSQEWDHEKNWPLTPKDVTPGMEKNVWWKCEKGHSWQKWIFLRTAQKDKTCPYCKLEKNSLKNKNPKLCLLWDHEKNFPLTPDKITYGSNKYVWWKCKNGHSFYEQINQMNRRKEENWCKYCKN